MKIDCFKADSMMLMKHCISVDEEKKRNRKVTISDAQLLTEIMEAFLAIGEATNMVFDSEFLIEAQKLLKEETSSFGFGGPILWIDPICTMGFTTKPKGTLLGTFEMEGWEPRKPHHIKGQEGFQSNPIIIYQREISYSSRIITLLCSACWMVKVMLLLQELPW